MITPYIIQASVELEKDATPKSLIETVCSPYLLIFPITLYPIPFTLYPLRFTLYNLLFSLKPLETLTFGLWPLAFSLKSLA